MNGQYYAFFLDGLRLQDDPKDWEDIAIIMERNTELNGLFTTYTDKMSYVGDGYDYLVNLIDNQNFCGEVKLEIFEYLDNGRMLDGFGFTGIIDLSNAEVNRTERTVSVSAEEDSLINTFKKYSSLDVPVNKTTNLTLNGEPLPQTGTVLNVQFPNHIYGYQTGFNTFAYLKYFDLLQYILNYITDNRITLSSALLGSTPFEEARIEIAFSLLGGGDTSVISYNDFAGIRQTWTISGPLTAAQHADAFLQDHIFHYVDSADENIYQNDLTTFPFINFQSSTVVEIRSLHNPDFDTGSFATLTQSRSFSDGAANVGVTTPQMIRTQGTIGNVTTVNFDDIYREIANIYDTEIVFRKINGVYTCIIEKRSTFLNTLSFTLTLTGIDNYSEVFADDLFPRNIKYSQKSQEGVNLPFLLRKADYILDGCGIKEKNIALKYYYGAEANINASLGLITDDNTLLPVRSDDGIGTGGFPTGSGPYWGSMYLTGYNDATSTVSSILVQMRNLAGDFAIHPLVVKRRLENINALAKFNGYEIPSDNTYKINKVLKFDYPLTWPQYESIMISPSNPIKIILSSGREVSGWIKKTQYKLKSGITDFELYSQ